VSGRCRLARPSKAALRQIIGPFRGAAPTHEGARGREAFERVIAAHKKYDIKALRQPDKGKADAVFAGFAAARGDVIMILDADLTTPPEQLPKFWEAIRAGKGEFIWADAATPPAIGGEKVATGDWCAVRCTVEGYPVTVLMLAHPANPRPGEWFTMSKPFCYLSATLNLKNEPFTLAKGQSWTLRYSNAVLSTPADHARLASLAAAWKTSKPSTSTPPSNPTIP